MSTAGITERLDSLEHARRLKQLGMIVVLAVILGITYLGLQFVNFSVDTILDQAGAQWEFVTSFFPPNFVDFTYYSSQLQPAPTGFEGLWASFRDWGAHIIDSLGTRRVNLMRMSMVTLTLGFVGTVLGFPLALMFGVLGSERVIPFPFNFVFRGTMSAIRAIPALVWILIYIPIAGISPMGAVLAIATDTIGNLGRLFTDEMEEIADGPIEAIQSTGGSRSQVVSFGMLSQVSSSFVAWTLYCLEINTRIAISLGVVGAGGIGQYIKLRQQLFQYQKAAAGIVMVFVIVLSVELLSSRIRSRLRPGEHEGKSVLDALRDLGDVEKWLGTGGGAKN